ncbi:MAG: flagellar biosynthesis anti-sigma factor FlgM [Spirochaetales bacterium]|nr:flagellar biosynthesis anti-sigma factor FlgM [Spirochaetales bacterium]
MTIDRIGPVDPVSKLNKTENTSKVVKKDKADSITFSDEARNMSEIYKATENVRKAPDVRMDRVEEVRKKLEDPSYIDSKVVEKVAEEVMDLFGLS